MAARATSFLALTAAAILASSITVAPQAPPLVIISVNRAVVVRGRLLDRAELENVLAEVKTSRR